ncbi:MAG TPA: polysaccharide biosynthesis C-terminal domain-containing protein, partial [Solirubrobacteraceae bacterium]|nr:polysaccharide biosynthesis C-terminal domain-containing protein [Solirubrobacteraceae bacterium]
RLRALLAVGVPIGVSGVLVIGYARVDQVIVYAIAGSRPAGLYSAVYNVLDQSHFVPLSILTTLAPIIAASFAVDRERMFRVVRLAAELMAVGSFGALAFAIAASSDVVTLIFGAGYRSAAPALPVLGGAFVFICFGYINGNLLTVLGLQRRLLGVSLAALVFNVAGNLVLVPAVGFMGAAWMTLLTEMLVCALSVRLILRALERPLPWSWRIFRTAMASLLLLSVLLAVKALGAPLLALVATACVAYPALLSGLRALELADVRVLLRRETLA